MRLFWEIVVGAFVALCVIVAAYDVAHGQTRDEWRAMEHRTGVTRENACLLLALDLTPCEANEPKARRVPKERKDGHG